MSCPACGGPTPCAASSCPLRGAVWHRCAECGETRALELDGTRACLNGCGAITRIACATCGAFTPAVFGMCLAKGCATAFRRRTVCAFCGRARSGPKCTNTACRAAGVEWRSCAKCGQAAVAVLASGPPVCISAACTKDATVIDTCAACGRPYPGALMACPNPACPSALQIVEVCFFCKRHARIARTGSCQNRDCPRHGVEVRRCAACNEAAEIAGTCFHCNASASPVEALLDRLSARSHFEERYEVLGRVHGGGMGEILRANDLLLGREVAIKVAHSALAESAAAREQFLKEARIGGRLLHPNVLPVFDVGVTRARQLYFTMRFVNGESLRRSLDAVATACSTNLVEFPLRRLVDTFAAACRGVDFAHVNRVLHLDLKPDNVLVSGFSEVFIIDWGLARVDGVDDLSHLYGLYGDKTGSSTTMCGYNASGARIIGTPGFMAPEQVEGDPNRFGQPTDVFGLGGILYYILYGYAPCRPPGVTDVVETFKLALQPQRAGRLREGILPRGQRVRKETADYVGAVERICMKCLERDPRQRYPRVEDLLADLNEINKG